MKNVDKLVIKLKKNWGLLFALSAIIGILFMDKENMILNTVINIPAYTGKVALTDDYIKNLAKFEKKQAKEVEAKIKLNDFKVKEAAFALIASMEQGDAGRLKGYKFDTILEAKKVTLYTSFEILNTDSIDTFEIYRVGNQYEVGWKGADETLEQQRLTEEFINKIWEDNKETIESLATDKEKADWICTIITYHIFKYDSTYTNRSVYDMAQLATAEEQKDKAGVCTAFAVLMDRLCEQAGIESEILVGKADFNFINVGALHCWNQLHFKEDNMPHFYDLTVMSNGNKTFGDMKREFYKYTYTEFKDSEYVYRVTGV